MRFLVYFATRGILVLFRMATETNDFDLNHSSDNKNEPSDIQSFYNGMTVFLTGATGFIGRLVLEKLLRTCLGVKTIYILIREKKGKTTKDRFKELFDDSLFESMKQEQPKSLEKVTAVIGDCSLPNLGLTKYYQEVIQNEVNIIIHSAATVNFNEHLRLAANINIVALRDLLILSKGVKNLKSFVHVSTAFSNCTTERKVIDEVFYKPHISGDELLYLTKSFDDDYITKETPRILKSWPNTYTITKAIAESELLIYGEGLPVGIIRPSMIVSTAHDPVSGWINNIYGPVGVTAGVVVGFTRCMCVDLNINADIVPGDFVNSAILACAWDIHNRWKEHNESIKSEENRSEISKQKMFTPPIYNYVSFTRNPVSWRKFFSVNMDQYKRIPSVKANWYPILWTCNSKTEYKIVRIFLHVIPGLMADYLAKLMNMEPPKVTKKYNKMHQFCDLISFFSLQSWSFRENNTVSLLSKLSEQDQSLFQFDISKLNWNDYITNYMKGIRIYVLKDPMKTVPQGIKYLKKLYVKHYTLLAVIVAVLLLVVHEIISLFL